MDTPAVIEQRFRSLMHEMHGAGSPRARVLRASRFLQPLLDGGPYLDPYLPEVVETLIRLVPQASFVGTDPEAVGSLVRVLELAQLRRAEISTLSGLQHGLAVLRDAVALQYAFAGERGKALDQLLEAEDRTGSNSGEPIPEQGSLLDYYTTADAEAGRNGASHSGRWAALLDRWRSIIESTRHGAVVPVIEQYIGETGSVSAGLRTIRFGVFTGSPDRTDHIHASVALAGIHDTVRSIFGPALRAARSFIAKTQPRDSVQPISCHIQFDGGHSLHSGESANLALAALACCQYARLLGRRDVFSIEPRVAISGGIDDSGAVRPVHPRSLAAKVTASFFSWIEHLVLPLEQLEPAKQTLQNLQQLYPRRHLNLIGVTHLRDLFFDRRITRLTQTNFAIHLAHQIWSHRRAVAVVLFLALLLIIARLWYGPLDKQPTGWKVSAENIIIHNSSGDELDRIFIGRRTALEVQDVSRGYSSRAVATLLDVDGDGSPEIVWAQSPDTRVEQPPVVMCRGIGESKPRWTVPLQRQLRFPHRPDIQGEIFMWYRVDGGDYDGDGKSEVYVLANHQGFPGLFLKLDGATGRELGAYVHAGHFMDMRTADLDGDGAREILLCGVNNSLRSGCFLVFKADRIQGYSPHAPLDALDSASTGNEYAYIVIPRTVVGEAFRKQVKYNIVTGLQVHEGEKALSLIVQDAFVNTAEPTERFSSTVFPRFDFAFRMLSMQTGDDFDALYDYLVQTGRIDPTPRIEYISSYVRAFAARQQPILPPSARE